MISGIVTNMGGVGFSVSGMNAGQLVQDVASTNIANVNSKDYMAMRVELSPASGGGVEASISTSNEAPLEIYNTDGSTTTYSNVNLIDEVMNLKSGGILVEANAAAYTIQAKTLGTIIDTMA